MFGCIMFGSMVDWRWRSFITSVLVLFEQMRAHHQRGHLTMLTIMLFSMMLVVASVASGESPFPIAPGRASSTVVSTLNQSIRVQQMMSLFIICVWICLIA
jgi:hypothetical protein